MDILAQRWTKWHENGQFGRERGVGTEIATFKVKTFKSDLLVGSNNQRLSYSVTNIVLCRKGAINFVVVVLPPLPKD